MVKKNQRYRKQKRKNFPWLLAALGGGLLLLAIIPFVRSNATGDGTPSIAIDQGKIDYGYVRFGETRQFAIKVTNNGDGTLRFKAQPYIEVLEGCWPPELTIGSMVLQPGQSTIVQSAEFMMHEGMDGLHNFGVHLKTNDPNSPDLVVNVISDWGP